MMQKCCGPDGRPDFDKMSEFMDRQDRASAFDAVGWALFFIWVGIAWLLELGFGWGLLGIGLLTLGMQGARRLFNVGVEGFWVVIGLGFFVAGFWELWNIDVPLAPIILIAVGVALLYWRVVRTDRKG
jgi:sterol desaturase/sphingolipid hydroxylase (fatty acid hydroxylase superfamily)